MNLPADLSDLGNDDLQDAVTELVAHIDAATCRFLVLFAELDKRKLWCGVGVKGPAHWLSWKCGVALGTAREHVRVARALPGLPLIREAFAVGRVSYSKVRALTRTATAETEAYLLDIAFAGTASHVETLVRQQRTIRRLGESGSKTADSGGRELGWHWDTEGRMVLKAKLPPDLGLIVLNALKAAMDVPAGTPPGPEEADGGDGVRARRADALAAIADSYLAAGGAAGESSRSGGERTMVTMHVGPDDLRQGRGTACCVDDAPALPAETARRLACDASRVVVVEDETGSPLDIGRRTRTVPPSIRRALRLRDRGCVFPGCTCTRWVDAHHIVHWADDGETALSNLVELCRYHHRLVHEAGFSIRHLGGKRFEWRAPDGSVIERVPRRPGVRGDAVRALALAHRREGIDIGPRTAVTTWHGETMDYTLAHGVLWQLETGQRPPGSARLAKPASWVPVAARGG